MISTYELLNWLHIVLFAYWLGADFGVYFGAKVMARRGLSYTDRMRVREIVMVVDLAPRAALILILPVGFHMAALGWGLALGPAALAAIWLVALAWLVLMLCVHYLHGHAQHETLRRSDLWVRYSVLAVMLALGGMSLLTGAPIAEAWLALKVLLFAGIIGLGLALRIIAAAWAPAMAQLRAERNMAEAEQSIVQTRNRAAKAALLLWTLLLVMSFLGTTKPF
jgi:uncharacterized membrane protein